MKGTTPHYSFLLRFLQKYGCSDSNGHTKNRPDSCRQPGGLQRYQPPRRPSRRSVLRARGKALSRHDHQGGRDNRRAEVLEPREVLVDEVELDAIGARALGRPQGDAETHCIAGAHVAWQLRTSEVPGEVDVVSAEVRAQPNRPLRGAVVARGQPGSQPGVLDAHREPGAPRQAYRSPPGGRG